MPDAEPPPVGSVAQASRSRSSPPRLKAHRPPVDRRDFPIVAIGASAGGLEACTKLLEALAFSQAAEGSQPGGIGMAFILVQHLDPTQNSLLVDLLAGDTVLTVQQATEGMTVEREHLYVIPPGTYLSVQAGALRLSEPKAPRGARLPFDFLLQSLAVEYGPRVICVVLSGSGADGSTGLRAVKDSGGRVVVQDPEEAGYDGMPRSAIATGLADAVLPVGRIPAALTGYRHPDARQAQGASNAAFPSAAEEAYSPVILFREAAAAVEIAKQSAEAANLAESRFLAAASHDLRQPVIFVVDDDAAIRAVLRGLLEANGNVVEDYTGGAAFLAAYRPGRDACLLVDEAMPGMDGLELLRRLDEAGHRLPAIMITGHGDVATAVRAMKAGALDFIEKPVRAPELLASIGRALDLSRDTGERAAWRAAAAARIAGLSKRQLDVMSLVLAGHPSKNIAADLGISQRTVDNHRASIMRKTGAKSLPALARLALAATA